MSYIVQRRGEEKGRRRAEILDSADTLYAEKGWDAVTIGQVARSARLSRVLVYVYFRDKEDLLFAIGKRALHLMRDRFIEASAACVLGMDKVEAIGRAYMGYAYEFFYYFDFCSRFQAHSVALDPGSHEGACRVVGDSAIGTVAEAIAVGMRDGSIRANIGDPLLLATTLWACTHGLIQLAMAKGSDLAKSGIAVPDLPDLSNYAFGLIRTVTQSYPAAKPG